MNKRFNRIIALFAAVVTVFSAVAASLVALIPLVRTEVVSEASSGGGTRITHVKRVDTSQPASYSMNNAIRFRYHYANGVRPQYAGDTDIPQGPQGHTPAGIANASDAYFVGNLSLSSNYSFGTTRMLHFAGGTVSGGRFVQNPNAHFTGICIDPLFGNVSDDDSTYFAFDGTATNGGTMIYLDPYKLNDTYDPNAYLRTLRQLIWNSYFGAGVAIDRYGSGGTLQSCYGDHCVPYLASEFSVDGSRNALSPNSNSPYKRFGASFSNASQSTYSSQYVALHVLGAWLGEHYMTSKTTDSNGNTVYVSDLYGNPFANIYAVSPRTYGDYTVNLRPSGNNEPAYGWYKINATYDGDKPATMDNAVVTNVDNAFSPAQGSNYSAAYNPNLAPPDNFEVYIIRPSNNSKQSYVVYRWRDMSTVTVTKTFTDYNFNSVPSGQRRSVAEALSEMFKFKVHDGDSVSAPLATDCGNGGYLVLDVDHYVAQGQLRWKGNVWLAEREGSSITPRTVFIEEEIANFATLSSAHKYALQSYASYNTSWIVNPSGTPTWTNLGGQPASQVVTITTDNYQAGVFLNLRNPTLTPNQGYVRVYKAAKLNGTIVNESTQGARYGIYKTRAAALAKTHTPDVWYGSVLIGANGYSAAFPIDLKFETSTEVWIVEEQGPSDDNGRLSWTLNDEPFSVIVTTAHTSTSPATGSTWDGVSYSNGKMYVAKRVVKDGGGSFPGTGAVYRIYNDAACRNLATDINGGSLTIGSESYQQGGYTWYNSPMASVPLNGASSRTVYVKEYSIGSIPPAGFGWSLDTNVYTVVVTSASMSNAVRTQSVNRLTQITGYVRIIKAAQIAPNAPNPNPGSTNPLNASPTGATYKAYLDPECRQPAGAYIEGGDEWVYGRRDFNDPVRKVYLTGRSMTLYFKEIINPTVAPGGDNTYQWLPDQRIYPVVVTTDNSTTSTAAVGRCTDYYKPRNLTYASIQIGKNVVSDSGDDYFVRGSGNGARDVVTYNPAGAVYGLFVNPGTPFDPPSIDDDVWTLYKGGQIEWVRDSSGNFTGDFYWIDGGGRRRFNTVPNTSDATVLTIGPDGLSNIYVDVHNGGPVVSAVLWGREIRLPDQTADTFDWELDRGIYSTALSYGQLDENGNPPFPQTFHSRYDPDTGEWTTLTPYGSEDSVLGYATNKAHDMSVGYVGVYKTVELTYDGNTTSVSPAGAVYKQCDSNGAFISGGITLTIGSGRPVTVNGKVYYSSNIVSIPVKRGTTSTIYLREYTPPNDGTGRWTIDSKIYQLNVTEDNTATSPVMVYSTNLFNNEPVYDFSVRKYVSNKQSYAGIVDLGSTRFHLYNKYDPVSGTVSDRIGALNLTTWNFGITVAINDDGTSDVYRVPNEYLNEDTVVYLVEVTAPTYTGGDGHFVLLSEPTAITLTPSPYNQPPAPVTVNIDNPLVPNRGRLSIRKHVPDGYSAAGAVYGVYTDPQCRRLYTTQQGFNGRLTIGSNGSANAIISLPSDTWSITLYVKEISPPTQTGDFEWGLDNIVYPVTITPESNTVPVRVDSTDIVKLPVDRYIKVHKDVPSGSYSPEGAEYGLYVRSLDDGSATLVHTFVIGADGNSDTYKLRFGFGVNIDDILEQSEYYVVETKAPTQTGSFVWNMDATEYVLDLRSENTVNTPVMVNSENTVTVNNNIGYVMVRKTVPSGFQPLGAEYTVYNDIKCRDVATDIGRRGILVIGPMGTSPVSAVPLGSATSRTIYIKETRVPVQTGDFEWTIDPTIYEVTVTVRHTASAPMVVESSDDVIRYQELSIEKIVTGNMGDKTKEFNFQVVVQGASGNYNAVMNDGTTRTVSFENSVTQVTLSHGQRITIKGLPYGAAYVVREIDTYGYTVSYDGCHAYLDGTQPVAKITNRLGMVIPTGVVLGAGSGVALLGAAGLGFTLTRRRRRNDD